MNGGARKILVVDDEPDVEDLLLRRLRREVRDGRYAFVFARDGHEALQRLRDDPEIELVLSDINMPGMDGLTLLDQIPSVDPNVRAVVVSAYDDMHNIRTAMNRGAVDFVTKPIDFNDLRVTIDKTLGHLDEIRDALATRDRLIALRSELELARQMQQSILPTAYREIAGYDVFGMMQPARDVGGDFFDVLDLDDGRVGLAIGDVSGRGVPAAMFMMSSRSLVKGVASGPDSPAPGDLLQVVNQLLHKDDRTAMFASMFYAVLDPENGVLQYANAGHRSPLIVHPDGSSTTVPELGGVALGAAPEIAYRQGETRLEPGDVAVLYTDGAIEASDAENEKFGVERLRAVVANGHHRKAQEVSGAIVAAVRAFCGTKPQADDLACLVVLREPRVA